LLWRGEITSLELTQAVWDHIVEIDNEIKAYLTLTPEAALERAREVDALLAAKRRDGQEPSPLLGVPMAVKDVICTEGIETTCGSKILEGFIPPYSATVVERLTEAGAIILGKTNTDEFAMGSSTEKAVASGEAIFALGTDTGGSVRQPASLCGVVGLKPTYGRVSRYGLIAFASSLDQIGPLTRDVTDCALVLGVIAGYDPRDSTSLDLPTPNYREALRPDIKGLRIGVPEEYFVEGVEPQVAEVVRAAIDLLADLGAEMVEVSLPHTEYALPTYYLIAPAEASANLARYDGVRYGLSCSEANDIKAQKVRTLIKEDFDQAFSKCDVLVGPTSPTVAFKIGERVEDPLQMYLSDIFTLSQPLAGIPGISIPCGFAGGLPVGLQIIGPALGEETVLRVAYAYEQATEWHKMRPQL